MNEKNSNGEIRLVRQTNAYRDIAGVERFHGISQRRPGTGKNS